MRRVPSYLKGLAETRSRAAGELQRFQQLYDEIGRKLADAKAEIASCDLLIRKFDPQLNPNLIVPTRYWKGRYGKRGQLTESIFRILGEHWPEAITTTELCWKLQLEFELDFPTADERQRWIHHSINNRLKLFRSKGLVERLHNVTPEGQCSEVGRWRLVSKKGDGLEVLRETAETTGINIQQAKRRGRPAKPK